MVEVAYASMPILPTFPPDFARRLDAGSSRAMLLSGQKGGATYGDAAGKAAGSRFGSAFKTALKLGAVGGGFALFAGIKESAKEASDLNESINAVRVTYGKQAGEVIKLGGTAAKRIGLSRNEFQGLSVQYSNFVKTISKKNGGQQYQTLDELTTRVADFASVMNLDVAEAARLFQSGLAGETEPLRRYGLDLSAVNVKNEAIAMGMEIASEGLTEQQKVLARYSVLMKDTSKTQGDFANTSDELANQQRILDKRIDNVQAKFGKLMLPVLKDVVGFLNKRGIPAFKDFLEFATDEDGGLQRFADRIRPLAEDTLPAFASAFGDIRDFAKDALPFAEDLVGAFNNLPEGVKKGLLIGGGLVAAKRFLGGGDGGGRNGNSLAGAIKNGFVDRSGQLIADRLLKRFQTPIPVIVMNQGGIPGTPGSKPPPVVPIGPKVPPIGALPKWAPLIPVGIGSDPQQDSLFTQITGKEIPLIGGKGDKSMEREWPFGDPTKIEAAGTAHKDAGKKVDAHREALHKLITEIDKTPRQVTTRFNSKGTQQILDEARAIADALALVGAGGAPNYPGDETGRGFGSEGVFAGANVNLNVNTESELAAAARRARRKAARAGHR